jgi:hypothetical protein
MTAASAEAIFQELTPVRIAIVHSGKAKDSELEVFDNYVKGLAATNFIFSFTQCQSNVGYGAGLNLAFQAHKS